MCHLRLLLLDLGSLTLSLDWLFFFGLRWRLCSFPIGLGLLFTFCWLLTFCRGTSTLLSDGELGEELLKLVQYSSKAVTSSEVYSLGF